MNRKEYAIQLKLSKAKSLLMEIEVLKENKFFTTLISRLYYSCFHATKALLLTKDLVPKTHKGVAIMLHEYFTFNGLFDSRKAAFFSQLMEERIEDDYSDFMILDENDVIEFIEPAKEYVAYIEKLIAENKD